MKDTAFSFQEHLLLNFGKSIVDIVCSLERRDIYEFSSNKNSDFKFQGHKLCIQFVGRAIFYNFEF